MKSRAVGWVLFTGCLGSTVAAGCGGGSGGGTVGLASGCSLNSDCNSPLVCVFGLCHEACASDRDCPSGERCVSNGRDSVCQLPGESACSDDAASCGSGLSCFQGQCLNGCSASSPCLVRSDTCIGGQCIGTAGSDAGPDVSGQDSGHDGTVGDGQGQDSTPGDGMTGQDSTNQDSAGQDSQVNDSSSRDAKDSGPPIDAGPLGYIPSNFDFGNLATVDGGVPEGGVNVMNPPDVNLGANCIYASTNWPCLGPSTTIRMSDNTLASLYVVGKLTVQSSVALDLNTAPYPIIVAAFGDVQIDGAINAGSDRFLAGPGGWSWTNGPTQGPGGGGDGYSVQTPLSYAGGGSFCGVGGLGASSSGSRASAGGTYGTANLIPLIAGSAGGSYAPGGDWYGSGGGAFQISSRTSILVQKTGWIHAGGGGGYGGGGSGGAILLEAPTIDIAGNVAANGGAGGTQNGFGGNSTPTLTPAPPFGSGGMGSVGKTLIGSDAVVADAGSNPLGAGGGGAGRVRLNTQTGKATVTGILTPDPTTACATQGKLVY